MKSEKELLEYLEKCDKVRDFGMSKGPCPFDGDGELGCCAECSTPATLDWVLIDERKNPTSNMQQVMIDIMRGK